MPLNSLVLFFKSLGLSMATFMSLSFIFTTFLYFYKCKIHVFLLLATEAHVEPYSLKKCDICPIYIGKFDRLSFMSLTF